jgi:adenylate kinase
MNFQTHIYPPIADPNCYGLKTFSRALNIISKQENEIIIKMLSWASTRMRALIAGHSGLNKINLLNKLSETAKARTGKEVFALDFDSMLSRGMPYFLDSYMEKQRERWYSEFARILDELRESGAEHALIGMHLTYFRHNSYWSLVDLNMLKELKVNMLITLIDDAYSVWSRIVQRESRERHGVYMRLRDVFIWRTVETMMGDTIATALGVPHYVVAIKHPIDTFYKLIFTNYPKAYLSHPITHVRRNREAVQEIMGFAKKLREVATVFEPTTIDESIISNVTITKEMRWPTETDLDQYPIELKKEEVEEVTARNPITKRDLIQDQIMKRDYRYIQQSDMVVAYRPNYGGTLSKGVLSEVNLAVHLGKPVYVHWSNEDGNAAENPFEYVHEYFYDVEELIKFLSERINTRQLT